MPDKNNDTEPKDRIPWLVIHNEIPENNEATIRKDFLKSASIEGRFIRLLYSDGIGTPAQHTHIYSEKSTNAVEAYRAVSEWARSDSREDLEVTIRY